MTINFEDYKKKHKTTDERELEKREAEFDKMAEKTEGFWEQMELKYNNMPEGTKASEEDVDAMMAMFTGIHNASVSLKDQQKKMGLRPGEAGNQERSGKVVSIYQ